ncbi:DUF262 domain-containing protein [Xanthomonas sacchari]|uniref:DUF262 domain-containing protein n=2 Tax=Xanthomonas TaxID=338 RepID=UPI0020C467EA|nr:DUF262 domain-containing protein [Xanthomonas sacchari]
MMTTAAPARLTRLQAQLDTERRLVSFDSYDMTVKQIFDMFLDGSIFVPPEYQRQFVWDEVRESNLIESIFLGIPVPSLFMATNPDSTWEIVDGVQRLSTIAHFMGKDEVAARVGRQDVLKISGLEKISELDGLIYENLSKSMQLLFQTRPIRVTVLNDKSDLSVRFDLFERLNTGGVLLTNQEIRNCIFRGQFNIDLKSLSKTSDFLKVVKLKDSDQYNGTAEEYVLRFFAYLDDRDLFEHSVKDFLNSYMKKNSEKKITGAKKKLFRDTMAYLAAAFPTGIKRGQSSTTSAVLYEALAIGVAVAIQQGKTIRVSRLRPLVSDSKLKKFSTGATNSRKMLNSRIDYVADAM